VKQTNTRPIRENRQINQLFAAGTKGPLFRPRSFNNSACCLLTLIYGSTLALGCSSFERCHSASAGNSVPFARWRHSARRSAGQRSARTTGRAGAAGQPHHRGRWRFRCLVWSTRLHFYRGEECWDRTVAGCQATHHEECSGTSVAGCTETGRQLG